MADTMTTITDGSFLEAASALSAVDYSTGLFISVFAFGIIPLCTVLYLATHRHKASIRYFEDYQYEQNIFLATLIFSEVFSLHNLWLFVQLQEPYVLPIIAADAFVVTFACACMLLHHMRFEPFPRPLSWLRLLLPEDIFEELQYDGSQQTDDGEEPEWGSQDTTVYGDELGYYQTSYGDETQPLLQEWLAEQELLSEIDDDDDDDEDDDDGSTFSTSSTVNNEFIQWLDPNDSGYDSDISAASSHRSSISTDRDHSGDEII